MSFKRTLKRKGLQNRADSAEITADYYYKIFREADHLIRCIVCKIGAVTLTPVDILNGLDNDVVVERNEETKLVTIKVKPKGEKNDTDVGTGVGSKDASGTAAGGATDSIRDGSIQVTPGQRT